MMIWIIEDDSMYLRQAREIIDRVAGQVHHKFEVKSSDDWQWPPEFKVAGQNGAVIANDKQHCPLPEILILDLFQWANVFRGRDFYEQLRRLEEEKNKRPGAFIIIWSDYWSNPESIDFVKQAREKDTRFVALETKAASILEEAIKGCIGRIEEEQ